MSFEAGIVELGGHPMVLRPGETQLGRGESLRDTARVLARHVAAVGVRTRADARAARGSPPRTSCRSSTCSPRPPPVPGARRPADAARGVRRAGGAEAGLRRRRQQHGALARVLGAIAGVEVVVGSPPAYALEPGVPRRRRPARGRRRRQRDLHRRVGVDGRRGHRRRAPRRAGALPDRRRAARPRRRRARSRCTACPRTPARRSPRRCSTATASASGTRPRTAATPRRRCSSGCWPADRIG